MAAEFIPTTKQVRDGYAEDPEDEFYDPIQAPAHFLLLQRAFDRWLAKHDAEVYSRGYGDANREWQRAGDGRGLV